MRSFNSEFVGRLEERSIVHHALDGARDKAGVGILVEGIAGTGKSRLLEYTLARATAAGFLTLYGAASEGMEGSPYGLWLDAFRRQVRFAGTEFPPWLDRGSPWGRLIAFQRGAPLDGPPHAFQEISRALTHVAAPIVITLDDLHWADRASLDVLDSMVREITRQPIVLLATCRLEELRGRPDRAERIERLVRGGRMRRLPLRGFSFAETRELVARVLPAAADHGFLSRQLHRRTEGNPLFLEELLRLIVAGGGPDDALPASFREATRTRFAGLAREDLRLLQLASVIGDQFDIATLAYLARKSDSTVIATLRRLVQEQLIRPTADHEAFRFWHALARDVLYEDLLLPDRKALHRRIAQRCIASDHATAAPSAVAYHLEKAGEEADAATHYARAAERALEVCAFSEAFAHAERAFVFSKQSGTMAWLASRCGRLAGEIDAALDYCARAHATLADAHEPQRAAELLLHESDLHWLRGDGEQAGELLESVAVLHAAEPANADAPVWAWFFARRAHRAAMENRWADVAVSAEAAIAMSRRLALPAVEAHALVSMSLGETATKGTSLALATVRRGRALAERHREVEDIGRSYVVEVDLLKRAGDWPAARRCALEGADRTRQTGAPVILYPELTVSAVELLWRTGQWRAALERLPEAEHLLGEQSSPLVRCHLLSVVAEIALARHRLDEARVPVAGALVLAKSIRESAWALSAYLVAAELELARGQPAVALRYAGEARNRFTHLSAGERAELESMAMEAECALTANGTTAPSACIRQLGPAPAELPVRFFHELRRGFAALMATDYRDATVAFAEASEHAVALNQPWAEARARRWLASALEHQGDTEGRRRAVGERRRVRAILAQIPGRRDDGGTTLSILTAREREVVALVIQGLANKQVGARLSISERTVAVHVGKIFAKLGVDSRHRLTTLLAESGRSDPTRA